jgi:hypothetical protein
MSSMKSVKSIFFALSLVVFGWGSVASAAEYASGSYIKGGGSYNCKITCSATLTVYTNANPCNESNTSGACNSMVANPNYLIEKKKLKK